MFFQKNKKKEYSEISEENLNINSDYFNIFQKEFKNMFQTNNTNDINIIDNVDNINNNDLKIHPKINSNEILKNAHTKSNKKNILLDDKDIFFINTFYKYISNK